MGTKARKNGKAVEGVDIYMGGKVGKDAHLGTCVTKVLPVRLAASAAGFHRAVWSKGKVLVPT